MESPFDFHQKASAAPFFKPLYAVQSSKIQGLPNIFPPNTDPVFIPCFGVSFAIFLTQKFLCWRLFIVFLKIPHSLYKILQDRMVFNRQDCFVVLERLHHLNTVFISDILFEFLKVHHKLSKSVTSEI
jgi:hypothetical protein